MNEAISIYLYLLINKISIAMMVISSVAMIVMFLYLLSVIITRSVYAEEHSEYKKTIKDNDLLKKHYKKVLIPFFISLFIVIAIPSRKDLAWIIGGATAINVAKDNKEELEKLPKNILNATNGFLEGIQEESVKPTKEGGLK